MNQQQPALEKNYKIWKEKRIQKRKSQFEAYLIARWLLLNLPEMWSENSMLSSYSQEFWYYFNSASKWLDIELINSSNEM